MGFLKRKTSSGMCLLLLTFLNETEEAGGDATNFFFFFLLFRAAPAANGGSQARGRIRAAVAGLCHNHSNARSKLCLQPIPQLTAMLDP